MISDIDIETTKSIIRCFADDTRANMKVKNETDKQKMQNDLNEIYKWAEDNIMKFNESKFEQMTCGNVEGVEIDSYETSSGAKIERKDIIKDLGVITSNDLKFREHIDSIVLSCKIKQGIILRNFASRNREIMMKLYKSQIRSKAEYCCIV